ncbi:MAG: hypothetical protein KAT15_07135, partial [Bacteroidales bacterium]|nr:hypothetical protein [Bacteroidales bacterium]
MKTPNKHLALPLLILTFLLGIWGCTPNENQIEDSSYSARVLFPEPPRPEGQTDVIELRCD